LAKRVLDQASLQTILFFEKATGARLKDYVPEYGIFIVEQGDMGKAIGKNASTIKRLEYMLKKRVLLTEFNDDVTLFVKNLVYPAEVSDIKEAERVVTIHGKDTKSKGMIIGRDRSRLNQIKEIVKRHFEIDDIKVV
jgi:N utilization substance protein A